MSNSNGRSHAENIESTSRKRKLPPSESSSLESQLMRQAGNPEDGKKVYKWQAHDNGKPDVILYLIMPQHTEQTFADEVLSASLTHKDPPHETVMQSENSFKQIRILGRGSFGMVDEVESLTDALVAGKRYARKVFFKSVGSAAMESIRKELEITKSLCHEHIVSVKMTYDTVNEKIVDYAMIMEPVADFNLEEYMERTVESRHHEEPQKRDRMQKWFTCLSSGLAYLHARRIRHKDIKPSNILVKEDRVFYADFGLSKEFRDVNETTKTAGNPGSRTPMYCAPEVEACQPRGRKADVFSLGCTFIEVLTVLAGRSLEDFKLWRGDTGRQAYHYNLHRISLWATDLQERLPAAYLRGVLLCALDMLDHAPEIRPSSFHVTKRLVDLILSKPGAHRPHCKCIGPWKASGECQIILFPFGNEERPLLEPGRYNPPVSMEHDMKGSVCQHCQKEYGNVIGLIKHYISEHMDLGTKLDKIFCDSPLCVDRPSFSSEDLLHEHLRVFHKLNDKEKSARSLENSYLL